MKRQNKQENMDEEEGGKPDRELCYSHVLEQKYTDKRK